MTLLRKSKDLNYDSIRWSDVNEGDVMPEMRLEIPFRRVIQNVASCRDFFPGHHETAYAKHQNVKDIYINTTFFQGIVDRFITDWTGPFGFIKKRKIQMQISIAAGDTAIVNGQVTKKYEEEGKRLVDVELAVTNQDGQLCCPAKVVVMLP